MKKQQYRFIGPLTDPKEIEELKAAGWEFHPLAHFSMVAILTEEVAENEETQTDR